MGQEKPAVYLEKRQSQGIWGGLWCLPVQVMTPSSNEAFINTFNLDKNDVIHLEPFKHTFTHFHLQVHGIKIALEAPHPSLNEMHWFHEQDLVHVGLPKPIKTLLDQFWSSSF
jgi:A/G-specific adenine glycosylase